MNSTEADRVRERHWICAQRLRERRRELKLTQMDVAARLCAHGAEMTNRTLSSMENGRGLHLGWLPELAAVLDCTVSYLLGLTCDPGTWIPDGVDGGESETSGPPCWILGAELVDMTRSRQAP
jgi:transcriptional regulator with XRE-family HTH domain